MAQAENWAEMKTQMAKLTKAASEMPSPPRPDDEYAQKMNDLNRTIEGLNEQINGRVQQEEELDDV